jgi:cytochrome c-type biogenesis protein CcmH/NrfG
MTCGGKLSIKTKAMNKEKITAIFWEKLLKWEAAQHHQTSGYLYEKNYVEAMKEIEKEVLQEIITDEEGECEKKTSYHNRRNNSAGQARFIEAG